MGNMNGNDLSNYAECWLGRIGARYVGILPENYIVETKQLSPFHDDSFFYIDDNGKIVCQRAGFARSYDMGSEVTNKEVIEFTFRSYGKSLLLRNSDGIVVEYIRDDYINYKYAGIKAENVIKVAGGQMLKHDGFSYMITDTGKYVPADENGVIDIIPNGSGGVRKIYANEDSAGIVEVIDDFVLKQDNKLYKNGDLVASNIVSITKSTQSYIEAAAIVGDKIQWEYVASVQANTLANFVDASWISANRQFLQDNAFDCYDFGWIGSSSRPKELTNGCCIGGKQLHTKRHGDRVWYFAKTTSGSVHRIKDDLTLSSNANTDVGAQGFAKQASITPEEPILFERNGVTTINGFPEIENVHYGIYNKLCFSY